ncbi:tyrosine-type recombinase/integrase [Spirabiliibacterium falconis]|uniref:tyrosine-type recombinase/integrase n=1 Tax=Spirabiliibacterium falconis TaxID=572023 RepID=UPI001AADD31B|nr:site-specific integrase [Spirabiliibacterium falconis]MBE2894341.1 site-specific integrase [Spirabiliibacterium falconis]
MNKFFFFKYLSPATIESYQKAVRRLLVFYPDIKPAELTSELILEWRSQVLNIEVKPVTWNSYIRHLKALFSFAIEQKLILIKCNPFAKLFVRAGKGKRKIFTEDELNKISILLDDADDIPRILKPVWFIKALILTFQYTGIRRSQLLTLKVKNIRLRDKVIYIEGHHNKNHDDHIIPIPDILHPYLTQLVLEIKKRGYSDDMQLFNYNLFSVCNRRKGLLTTQHQLSHLCRVISKEIGISVSPHRFRHTIATKLMKEPENVYIAQKLLGHRDIKVTLSYIEHDVDMIRNKINALI